MKEIYVILVLFQLSINAQISIEFIDNVPQKFKEKYYSNPRNSNPLEVGNVWEYYYDDFTYPFYRTTIVDKDSIINGIQYFKKVNWQSSMEPDLTNFISWERNDSLTGISWMLDFQDIDEDGDSLDELILDSMITINRSNSLTYKYSFNNDNFFSGPKHIFLYDTSWIKIANDTLLSRSTEISELFWQEKIADNFGIWETSQESPTRYLTGAIVNGKKYGTIVGITKMKQSQPFFRLYHNYPNPFNPETTISYSLDKKQLVNLSVFNLLGEKISELVNSYQNRGEYSVIFDASNFSSGIYFYSLNAGTSKVTKSMVFVK